MDKQTATDRRSFLKSGAILAAPVLAAAPVAALADDGTRARLARLEDERAIEALQRGLLRHLNGNASNDMAAPVVEVGELRSIAETAAGGGTIELAADGLSASARTACRVERQTEFTGQTTIEQMARFQGQGSHVHAEERVLATDFIKNKDGWQIARARFA
ncbi:MAG: hypothetical protein ABIT16_09170 [Croceibacterium sp.]